MTASEIPGTPSPSVVISGGALRDLVAGAEVFALPMRERFRGITERDGMIFRGPAGWGEFAPFHNYTDEQCLPWLDSAIEAATFGWPAALRTWIPVNTTVPVVAPGRAAELVTASGCSTAKVKVADPGDFQAVVRSDCARVSAVRAALGREGRIRVDANGGWTVDEAVHAITALDDAAQGLEYVEQPCAEVSELAAVRRRVRVPVAADESIRLASDPERVALAGAADIAVIKVAPLGGVRRALQIARSSGLQVVVSSAIDSAVGLAAGLALAAALPELDLACGLGTGSLLVRNVSSDVPRMENGRLAVPATAPEPDLISGVRARSELDQYWRERLTRVVEVWLRRRDS